MGCFISLVGGGSAFFVRHHRTMNTSIKSRWDGIAALVWLGAIIAITMLAPSSFWSYFSDSFLTVFWTFGWWLPILILAVSGLVLGNTTSKICALIAIFSAIAFAIFIFVTSLTPH